MLSAGALRLRRLSAQHAKASSGPRVALRGAADLGGDCWRRVHQRYWSHQTERDLRARTSTHKVQRRPRNRAPRTGEEPAGGGTGIAGLLPLPLGGRWWRVPVGGQVPAEAVRERGAHVLA